MDKFDVVIVGGGIVGLATAWRLNQTRPDLQISVLEKEANVGDHQTGHNSGVLHSGIYYRPGSLKAVNCREGKIAMQAFCSEQGIPFELCGKVIVATQEQELPALKRIYERGQANQIRCEWIDRHRLKELEPHAAGIQAIHVPDAGIVNYRQVCERLARLVQDRGQSVLTGYRVTSVVRDGKQAKIQTTRGDLTARLLVNCAGLYSDRVTKAAGDHPGSLVVPFRGEYFELKPQAEHLCRGLIYPVPDPKFPFLGVHFTRMIQGGVECGPNAVLAFAREGYTKSKINLRDLGESLTYPGFLRMALRHWKKGLNEMWRSCSKAAFVRGLQKLVPEIKAADLRPAPAGVRAQAILRDGTLVDDFLFTESETAIHVINAASPAATAALNIGRILSDKITARF
jgi:L-2-hydroxyglutarate oxidase